MKFGWIELIIANAQIYMFQCLALYDMIQSVGMCATVSDLSVITLPNHLYSEREQDDQNERVFEDENHSCLQSIYTQAGLG